jgi:uncharacterized protein (DUF2147 family)
MKPAFLALLAFSLVVSHSLLSADPAVNSPIGKWRTIDDSTKEEKSIVEISETSGRMSGKITKIFPKPGKDPNPKCDKCSGDRKDKPILGMTILWDLSKDGDTKWSGGKVLDPENGKTYSCHIRLLEGGKKLNVRGFLGISLLGRSQTWERQE